MEQKKIIGENIKAARKLKGLSQRALAEKLGIAFQNLSVWENGKGAPSARYLLKLSEVLDVSLDQLTTTGGIMSIAVRTLERSSLSHAAASGFSSSAAADSSDMARVVQRELSDNHTLKLVVAYLEEILSLLRGSSPQPRPAAEYRRVAEGKSIGYGINEIKVPLPPTHLSTEERLKWERNAAALLKWSQSEHAFWSPEWALEKYCREGGVGPFGGTVGEITQLLKAFMENGKDS